MRGGRLKQFPDPLVIPAQAGTQRSRKCRRKATPVICMVWVPACAGMTIQG